MARYISTCRQHLSTFIILCIVCFTTIQAYGLPNSHYASHSVLSNGRWVKIATTQSGIHKIDKKTLKEWGFDNAAKVSIYGQNGYILPEQLSATDTDDLKPIPVYTENGDLYFYASGTIYWDIDENDNFVHTNNYYTLIQHYFLTEELPPLSIETENRTIDRNIKLRIDTTFDEHLLHEKENINVGQTGRYFFGEDLLQNNSIEINTPDITGSSMQIHIALASKASSIINITTTANGVALSPNIIIIASDSYSYIKESNKQYNIPAKENTLFTFLAHGSGNVISFYLDYIRMLYTRNLALNKSQLQFRRKIENDVYAIDIKEHNAAHIKVWDVTDASHPIHITTDTLNNRLAFAHLKDNNMIEEYIVFDTHDQLYTPSYVCEIEPQDLHGIEHTPDMIIVSTQYLLDEAERIAQLHRDIDNMNVIVCDQMAIYNEFSGGNPDATAIRKFVKMFYDRSQNNSSNPPRYLLLYGNGTYNNRLIAESMHKEDNNSLITYQSINSNDERYSYVTDDYFGYLSDNSGNDVSAEEMQIAIGRIPVSNTEEAQNIYHKIEQYATQKPIKNLWKNKACFIGLNGDNLLHIKQIEKVASSTVELNQPYMITDKIYMSAFDSPTENLAFNGAIDRLYNDLYEGAILYNYMGHAGIHSLGDDIITIADAKNMKNSIYPVFITATCDVYPFDKDVPSIGEALFKNRNGGFIGLYTTTRTVYTTGNININKALMDNFFTPGYDGKIRLGDIMLRAKKAILYDSNGKIISDTNKLKYCLIGDPALSIPLPTYNIQVEKINNTSVTSDTTTIAANSSVTIEGSIYDEEGRLANTFDGILCYEVYDGRQSMEAKEDVKNSLGQTISITQPFGIHQHKLVVAADTVIEGHFKTTFHIPQQCAINDSTGLISLYAFSNDNSIEATGYNKNFIIDGYASQYSTDTTSPIISNAWIGSTHFFDGDIVEAGDIFHCEIEDSESGIVTDEISIGKSLSISIDNAIYSNDISGYYTPATKFGSGSINFPIPDLPAGTHTISLRGFDIAGNSSETTLSFTIENPESTQYLLSIQEDPLITQATIHIEGNEAYNDINTRIVITHEATGKEVWNTTTTNREVIWDLNGTNGRVAPGCYLCRAYIIADYKQYITPIKKLIVLGQ